MRLGFLQYAVFHRDRDANLAYPAGAAPHAECARLDFAAAMLGKSGAEMIKGRFQGEIEPLRLNLAATVKRD